MFLKLWLLLLALIDFGVGKFSMNLMLVLGQICLTALAAKIEDYITTLQQLLSNNTLTLNPTRLIAYDCNGYAPI